MQKIVVVLEGGLVKDVYTTSDAEVLIADLDIEGLDPEDTFNISGVGESYTTIEKTTNDTDFVKEIFANYEVENEA